MRAVVLTAGLLFFPLAHAMAQPPALVIPEPFFSERYAVHTQLSATESDEDLAPSREARGHGAYESGEAPPKPLSLGPFSMDIGSSDTGKNGRTVQFAHVHLQDVHVLGGNISGTFDGRAATLRLSWPTGS